MNTTTAMYDAIVIGAGSGGLTNAIGLTGFGKRVAVIEARWVGGDCTNVGCVPSKTLLHEAEEQRDTPNSARVFQTVQQKRNDLRDKETHEIQNTKNLDLIFGYARFLDPHRVAIQQQDGTTREIVGKHIIIATGSRPRKIDIPGLPDERVVTNETLFELPAAPRHIAIVGSGPIGMEMATAFLDLGSRVTLITRDERVLRQSPPEASEALQSALGKRGVTFYFNATTDAYEESNQTLTIKVDGKTTPIADVDLVLLAVGRIRNIEALDLEKAGVEFDKKDGIPTTPYGRTNVSHIYAIGDVTPTSHFTHSANAQGRRVNQRIAFPFLPALGKEPLYPAATYSKPEVATVGFSHEEIARRFHPNVIKRIRVDLKSLDRGYTDSAEEGFVMVDAIRLTGKIIGATIVGARASDMITVFTLAMTEGISLYKLFGIVYPYPSYSEGIKKVADEFMRSTLPNLPKEIIAYLRYRWASPPQKHLPTPRGDSPRRVNA